MKFRPCIDIHNGKVKQIVGSSLSEDGSDAVENFVSEKSSADFAMLYKKYGLTGGHVIKLSATPEDDDAMLAALRAYPGGLQAGGGMNDSNCLKYLEAGASHVIVTSYVFNERGVDFDRLERLVSVCGKDRLVLDLSCRRKSDPADRKYYIAVNRWQVMTDFVVNRKSLEMLSSYCDEFLIHGIGNEGKKKGPDCGLVKLISSSPIPVTYAGGISSLGDVEKIRKSGKDKVDFTVGSALDIFGGELEFEKLVPPSPSGI